MKTSPVSFHGREYQTAKGNTYKTTHAFKTTGLLTGAAAGVYTLSRPNIAEQVSKSLANFQLEVIKSIPDNIRGRAQEAFHNPSVKEGFNNIYKNLKNDGKIYKNINKCLSFVKKHLPLMGAIVGGIALLSVGSIFDGIANSARYVNADFQAKNHK